MTAKGRGALKKVKKPSVIPIYGIGAVWLAWCLTLPLYKLWHFLLLIALSAGGYVGLNKLFPGTTVYVQEPEPDPDTGNAALDEAIRQGRSYLAEMKRLNIAITDRKITQNLDEMERITGQIFDYVAQHPDQLGQIRRFMNYYLPTTLKLLNSYDELARQSARGENITQAMEKIEDMLDTVVLAFRKQQDSLFASQVMDITAEISVLESMMAGEGIGTDGMD